MPPRLDIQLACRSFALRSRPQSSTLQQFTIPALARHYADDATTPPSQPPLSSSPSPVRSPPTWGTLGNSVVSNIPGSMLRPGEQPPPSSSTQPIREEDVQMRELTQQETALQQLEMAAHGLDSFTPFTGYKFDEPPMPQGKMHTAQYHLRHRYDEGIAQLTRLLMRDGKLSKAQNDMARVLTYLRTSPPPKVNPLRPLLPGSPPPEHLPLNPNLYLMLAIDSVAPLIRIRGFTGLAGGGKALEVPVPLGKRARRRIAWLWLIDAVDKKPSMGSGKKQFAHRIGEEIVAIIEGRSSVWDRRNMLHKTGTSVRANMNSPALMQQKRL
ncbi:unnamed protein product [Discula destructiva]